MTVSSIIHHPTALREQVSAEHPTVLAVLVLAETFDNISPDDFDTIAAGLLERHARFIWTVKADLDAANDVETGRRASDWNAEQIAGRYRDSALTNARMAVSLVLADRRQS